MLTCYAKLVPSPYNDGQSRSNWFVFRFGDIRQQMHYKLHMGLSLQALASSHKGRKEQYKCIPSDMFLCRCLQACTKGMLCKCASDIATACIQQGHTLQMRQRNRHCMHAHNIITAGMHKSYAHFSMMHTVKALRVFSQCICQRKR